MTSVGCNRAGSGSWKISRFITSVSSTIQKISPAEVKNQAISTWPSGTPARATITLPTAGMNQAGVICACAKGRCPIQPDTTASVRISWTGSASRNSPCAIPGAGPSMTTDISSIAMEMAGKKARLTGLRHSSATAPGWRSPLAR